MTPQAHLGTCRSAAFRWAAAALAEGAICRGAGAVPRRRRWSGGGRGRAAHDPGKIITDLAVALALGGDCLADIAVLRAEPGLFGPVASDPVVSRLAARLAAWVPVVTTIATSVAAYVAAAATTTW